MNNYVTNLSVVVFYLDFSAFCIDDSGPDGYIKFVARGGLDPDVVALRKISAYLIS